MTTVCSIDDCDRLAVSRGMCSKHERRFRRHGDALITFRPEFEMTLEERFWFKVNKTDTCWLWTGALRGDGYGKFHVKRKWVYAHRFAYELLVGPIPDGLELDHLCRIRNCVRPSHLEPVTHQENMQRAIDKLPSVC